MTLAMPEVLPEATGPVAPGNNLLDVAHVVESDSLWYTDGDGVFMSFNKGVLHYIATERCGPTTQNKVFDVPAWAKARIFAVYKGVECRPVGLDQAETDGKARAAFQAWEPRAVAQAFVAATRPDEVIVGGAPAVDIVTGFASLADYAAANYSGRITWVVPRGVGHAMTQANMVHLDGTRLVNGLGEDVVAAGGYSGGTGTPKEYWIHAYGQIVLMRTPVEVFKAIDGTNNNVRVLAERSYVAAVDANFIATAKITVGCC